MAKILLVTHIFPPAVDGGSRVIFKFGEYLKSQGHQIMVLTSNANSSDDFTHRYKPVLNQGLPVYTIFHKPLKRISKVLAKGPIFKLLPFLKFLISCLRFHPNYIIAGPLPTSSVIYALILKKVTGAKLIINASFHPTDPEFSQPLLINCLKSADYLWTLTDFETNYFHQHFNIPLSKMINVGNGIDSSLIIQKAPPKMSKKILFIGSFSAHKGLETLFAAFQLLPHGFTLTVAGKPALHHIDIPHNVKIISNFTDKSLSKIIDNCTILVSPSTQESFGLVLLEAMARGKPVIAADIPASTELIDKSKAGLTFISGNSPDLAKKIIWLCVNNNQTYTQNGISFAADHTWDKIGDRLWQKIQ